MEAKAEHYKRIFEIIQQLNTTYDQQSLLRKICVAAKELIATEAAAIMLLDESSGQRQLRFAMSTNLKPIEMEEIIVPIEGSIAGWIVTHGEPRVIRDVSRSGQHFQGVDARIQFQTRNLLGVPMISHKQTIGVVQAVNKLEGGDFNDEDVNTLRTLASQAAIAIETARLFQQSDFIAELVHELRTPLMALKASTTLLKRPDLPSTTRESIVNRLQGETDRLIEMTNDFLDLARLESGRANLNIDRFSIYELVSESIDVVTPQAQAKEISIDADETDLIAEADRGKVKQVLLNLLTNAVKYNRPNGSIAIETSIIKESDGDDFIRISVRDSGYGIPLEHQKQMFNKFFRVPTTEDIARGTGLGLTICKHIVEAHGGHIWLESVPNQGSEFFFTIPLKQN